VLLIGSLSLGVLGCTCVLLLVGCSVLGRSVASVLVLVCSVLVSCFQGGVNKHTYIDTVVLD